MSSLEKVSSWTPISLSALRSRAWRTPSKVGFKRPSAICRKPRGLDKSPTILALAAHVHAVAGQKREAEKLIHDVEKTAEQHYFCPYEIGAAYVSLGDHDTAVKWFRKGVEDRADCMAWLGVEPWIESFRSDPRYAQLLRDVGLRQAPGGAPSLSWILSVGARLIAQAR